MVEKVGKTIIIKTTEITWRLTRRGRFVVAILILLFVSWLMNITTPEECKVPIGEMSQFCVDFLYP